MTMQQTIRVVMPKQPRLFELAYNDARAQSLLDAGFGKGRGSRGVYSLRRDNCVKELGMGLDMGPSAGATSVEESNTLLGCIFFWRVLLNDDEILLLGPITVREGFRKKNYADLLIKSALARARELNFAAVIVSGHAGLFCKHGFRDAPNAISLPDKQTPSSGLALMALELTPGALNGKRGVLKPFSV